MIELRAGAQHVTVPVVMAHAGALLAAASQTLRAGEQTVFDLSAVAEADSSAIALMLALSREAAKRRATVRFAAVPAGVRALAELYGVADLLPLA